MEKIVILLLIGGCSLLPPSLNEFKNTLNAKIGYNLKDKNMWGLGLKTKIINENKRKNHYYVLEDCQYILITDIYDTVLDYSVLTPKSCRVGISDAW